MDVLAGLGSLGCIGFLPFAITLIAILDIVRTGAGWYWILIVLFFPVLGALAYLLLVRVSWSGSGAGGASPATARRIQAQRRLREIGLQLTNWRGPALLAEAGEQYLVLGRIADAERSLREAQQAGASVEDVNFPLAQALEVQGRFAEAVPLLETLRRQDADQHFGAVQLHLARALDESGRVGEAEAELRDLLVRREFIEAQVRLARILLRRGEAVEAERLLAAARDTGARMPRYLRREAGPWIRAARRLKSGADKLPAARLEGAPASPRAWLWLLAIAVCLALVGLGVAAVVGGGRFVYGRMSDAEGRLHAARVRLARMEPAAAGPAADPARLEVTAELAQRYLAVRSAVSQHLAEAASLPRVAPPPSADNLAAALARQAHAATVRAGLVNALAAALQETRLTPSGFESLLAVFEWRCLRRPEAEVFGIPTHFHLAWRQAQARVRNLADLSEEDRGEEHLRLLRERDEARAQLVDFARLTADVRLSPSARTMCERLRPQLADLPAAGLDELGCLLDDEAGCS